MLDIWASNVESSTSWVVSTNEGFVVECLKGISEIVYFPKQWTLSMDFVSPHTSSPFFYVCNNVLNSCTKVKVFEYAGN